MQRFYKMWLEQLHPFVDALGAAGKADAAPARRQKVSLQADSAASSQFFQHGKQPQASSQGITRAPVVLFLLALILWLLYNLVLLGRQNLLPHVSSAMSAGLKLLPPVLPLSTVAVEVANQTAIVLM